MLANPDLKSRLLALGRRWAAAHGKDGSAAPLSRLSKPVTGDANFFDRIADGGGVNLGTLEKFGARLADPASWPGGEVPDEARAFAHVLGINPSGDAESAGKVGDVSPERDAA